MAKIMTNRERVIAAIRHENPDYTPHNVMFTSQMYRRMIEYTGNSDYIDTVNNHIAKISLRKPQKPVQGKPEHFTDEFGVEWDKSGADKDIGVVAEYLLNDAEQIAGYEPPQIDEDFIRTQCAYLVKNKSDNFTFASIGFTLFERAWSLCGMENLLCWMLIDPEAVESLFTKLTDFTIQKTRIVLEYDIDGILFGDDWGQQKGLIMGVPLWRKMIKPHVMKMYDAAAGKSGKFIAQHSCGDNSEILDDLIDMGLNIYQTFQPEIYDMLEYKNKLRRKLTIWGGISTQTQLPFLKPEEIYEITKTAISVLGEGGGYIASPTHEAPGDIPPENIEAMVAAFMNQSHK